LWSVPTVNQSCDKEGNLHLPEEVYQMGSGFPTLCPNLQPIYHHLRFLQSSRGRSRGPPSGRLASSLILYHCACTGNTPQVSFYNACRSVPAHEPRSNVISTYV